MTRDAALSVVVAVSLHVLEIVMADAPTTVMVCAVVTVGLIANQKQRADLLGAAGFTCCAPFFQINYYEPIHKRHNYSKKSVFSATM